MKSTSSCQTPSDVVFARAKALWYPPHKKAIIVYYYILHIFFLLCKSNKTNWMFYGKCYDDSKQPGGQSKLLYCIGDNMMLSGLQQVVARSTTSDNR